MKRERIPVSYWAFVLVSLGMPLLAMLSTGQKIHPKAAGLVIIALILWALARGSLGAWILSLLWSVVLSLAVGVMAGSGMELSGWLLLLTGVVSVWLLLTPSMRRHVGLGRRPHLPGPSLG